MASAVGNVFRRFVALFFCYCLQLEAAVAPWGQLNSRTVFLEPPESYLSDTRLAPEKLDWFIPAELRTTFLEQLNSFDLTSAQDAQLRDSTHWRLSTEGWRYSPNRDLLLGLTPQARSQIYTFLGKFPENIYQKAPFVLWTTNVDLCFTSANLRDETVSLLKRLLYKRGSSWCFSDVAIFGDLDSDEFKCLLRSLCRSPALFLTLRVTSESDVDALVNYWGKGSAAREVRTLIDSLKRTSQGAEIDIAHLLPRFARDRLYHYPDQVEPNVVTRQNCFWSALNFFSLEPDDRFVDNRFLNDWIKGKYIRTRDEPQFGDLIGLADDSGKVVHCSVYVADRIVFTKNGGHLLRPWLLMSIPDMVAEYSISGAHDIVVFRRKDFAADE